jgi:PleD family two-component response regulator
MVTGLGDQRVAVEAMREGVYDYLSKNQLRPEHIASAIQGSLRWAELEAQFTDTQERLQRLSLFDGLTSLPNRNLFVERLEQLLQSAQFRA